jgi:hypothetical protein
MMTGPTGSDERYSLEKMAGDSLVQLRDRVYRRDVAAWSFVEKGKRT